MYGGIRCFVGKDKQDATLLIGTDYFVCGNIPTNVYVLCNVITLC